MQIMSHAFSSLKRVWDELSASHSGYLLSSEENAPLIFVIREAGGILEQFQM